MQIHLPDEHHTRALGRWIAGQLTGGQVLSLEGPLGAGKTTLLQGLADGLGMGAQLTSPTFILFRVVPIPSSKKSSVKKSGITQLVHADAYRVKDPAELVATGFTEFVGEPSTLVVVEWGDRVKKLLPKDTLHVHLKRIKVGADGKDAGREVVLPEALGKLPKDWYTH